MRGVAAELVGGLLEPRDEHLPALALDEALERRPRLAVRHAHEHLQHARAVAGVGALEQRPQRVAVAVVGVRQAEQPLHAERQRVAERAGCDGEDPFGEAQQAGARGELGRVDPLGQHAGAAAEARRPGARAATARRGPARAPPAAPSPSAPDITRGTRSRAARAHSGPSRCSSGSSARTAASSPFAGLQRADGQDAVRLPPDAHGGQRAAAGHGAGVPPHPLAQARGHARGRQPVEQAAPGDRPQRGRRRAGPDAARHVGAVPAGEGRGAEPERSRRGRCRRSRWPGARAGRARAPRAGRRRGSRRPGGRGCCSSACRPPAGRRRTRGGGRPAARATSVAHASGVGGAADADDGHPLDGRVAVRQGHPQPEAERLGGAEVAHPRERVGEVDRLGRQPGQRPGERLEVGRGGAGRHAGRRQRGPDRRDRRAALRHDDAQDVGQQHRPRRLPVDGRVGELRQDARPPLGRVRGPQHLGDPRRALGSDGADERRPRVGRTRQRGVDHGPARGPVLARRLASCSLTPVRSRRRCTSSGYARTFSSQPPSARRPERVSSRSGRSSSGTPGSTAS